jgi:hypothetical protein
MLITYPKHRMRPLRNGKENEGLQVHTRSVSEITEDPERNLAEAMMRTGSRKRVMDVWEAWPSLRERTTKLFSVVSNIWPGWRCEYLTDEALVNATGSFILATRRIKDDPYAAYLGSMIETTAAGLATYSCTGYEGGSRPILYEPLGRDGALGAWASENGVSDFEFAPSHRIDDARRAIGMKMMLVAHTLTPQDLTLLCNAGMIRAAQSSESCDVQP